MVPRETPKDDVDRALDRERLVRDIEQSKKTRREIVLAALRVGTRPDYLAMRYSLPLEHVEQAKRVIEREKAAKEKAT